MKAQYVSAEADDVVRHLYSVYVGYRQTVTRPVLRALLQHLDNKYIRNGHIHAMRSKHIGAGIYEVWMEQTYGMSSL